MIATYLTDNSKIIKKYQHENLGAMFLCVVLNNYHQIIDEHTRSSGFRQHEAVQFSHLHF